MKKILGLDLGVASIGWALISEKDNEKKIIDLGSRIIPYSDTEGDDFSKGTGESKNQARTFARTARKGLDRYQLRRDYLLKALEKINAIPTKELIELSTLELFGLRSRAVSEKISLLELGRVLLHLNQRRGYKHGAENENENKTQRDYVAAINSRYSAIIGIKTIGQFFYEGIQDAIISNKYYRIKEQIFPREAYIEEFNTIWDRQEKEYPTILTDQLKIEIRDEIIYYQRRLKSQKGLVSICEFEGFWVKDKDGKEIFTGPKVAPRTSPLFQITKLWESINNITVKRINRGIKKHEEFDIAPFKKEIFDYLNTNSNLSETELFKILGVKKNDGYYTPINIRKKGIQGNITLSEINKALDGCEKKDILTLFNLIIEDSKIPNKITAEIYPIVSSKCEQEPLYQLWHTCYSIKDKTEKVKALIKRFKLTPQYAEALAKIDFNKASFSNKSNKAMRKILPMLMQGNVYSNAMEIVGYNHSNSITNEENLLRPLKNNLKLLPKNALRQPIVEKILNQMINLVNTITSEYGKPDEIRVELARELKQSKDERNDFFRAISQRNTQADKIAERLEKEYGVKGNRRNIEKWRLWHEVDGRCLYCDKQIPIANFLRGVESDVEHIIPKSIFFDDSFANKTISHVVCNTTKNNETAYDFMRGKTDSAFDTYIQRINELYKTDKADKAKAEEGVHTLTGKISGGKFRRLQWRREDIPQDFINRQLNETRFVAKKAIEILNTICRDVKSTSGSITETLRRVWGWGDILENLHIDKYRNLGLTEVKEWETNDGQRHKKEVIKDWSKRNDHRHHAIDALAVACTKQGFIQRLNTLSAEQTRNEMYEETKNMDYKEKLTLVEKHFIKNIPFTTDQVEDFVAEILVSFKAGKKVATISKFKATGKNLETGVIVPRGKLSEESVYGKIRTLERDLKTGIAIQKTTKYLFENPSLIFKEEIKKLVLERLELHEKDTKKAMASLKKEPIYLNAEKTIELKYGTCWKEEIVIKYPLSAITAKDVPYIVDEKIRAIIKERLELHNNKEKEAYKSPLYFDEAQTQPIRSVRCFTGLSAVETVKKDNEGNPIGFVLPKNNHHIAIYKNAEGELVESANTFWHCVERKAFFINYFTKEERIKIQENTIIKNPQAIWNKILSLPDYTISESFKEKLPHDDWEFVTSIQRNEMFVIGMTKEEVEKAVQENNYKLINQSLYRVQKIAESHYTFRHHLETKVDDKFNGVKNEPLSLQTGKMIRITSFKAWQERNPIKVEINCLGKIKHIK